MMMDVCDVAVGDVHNFLATKAIDRKDKLQACVTPCNFFFVNTRNNFDFSVPITKAEHGFLAYDSFVCCSFLSEYPDDHRIPSDSRCGPLSKKALQDIRAILPTVVTLSKVIRDPIIAALGAKIAALP